MNSKPEQPSELLLALTELATVLPEMRFGQLIVNLAYLVREPSHEATWEVEDNELLATARQLIAERRQIEGGKLPV